MKHFKVLFLTICGIVLGASLSMAQSKAYAKLQKDLSKETYDKTWFKKEKKNLKEAIKQANASTKTPKVQKRRSRKLINLREKLSEATARKEDGNE